MACVIGIDIGTSGVRTVVMDREQAILPGGAHCRFSDLGDDHRSPELWWQGVQHALSATLAQINADDVVAISVDGTSGTVLPVSSQGEPLATPMMYNDAVSDSNLLTVIEKHRPAHSAASGATSGLAKALVFQSLKPHAILHQADWIAGRLMNDFTLSDANNALKTGFDLADNRWPSWMAACGLNLDLLPDVYLPGAPWPQISSSISTRFGLGSTVRLVAGTTDGCASFLATGASRSGDAVTALGSTITLKLLSDVPVNKPQYGIYSHALGDQYLVGGASNSGGQVLAQFFDQSELEQLSQSIDPETQAGLDYYPLVKAGERFPINDPGLEPTMTPRPAEDSRFLHGLLEGMASIEKLGYQRLTEDGGVSLKSVRTVGGGATNPCWTAIRQRELAVPFLASESLQAAAGTARLAVRGASQARLW